MFNISRLETLKSRKNKVKIVSIRAVTNFIQIIPIRSHFGFLRFDQHTKKVIVVKLEGKIDSVNRQQKLSSSYH